MLLVSIGPLLTWSHSIQGRCLSRVQAVEVHAPAFQNVFFAFYSFRNNKASLRAQANRNQSLRNTLKLHTRGCVLRKLLVKTNQILFTHASTTL